jgi:hypothetical protein
MSLVLNRLSPLPLSPGRFFNQLPLHHDDWALLGLFIPAELHPDGEDAEYVSAKAHFGGSSFPAYANALMAAVASILRMHGIPVVFLTDDLFICGATEAECQRNLDKAVEILLALGWRLQSDKITSPAQRMAFLGIVIDTIASNLSIAEEKSEHYSRVVARAIEDASLKTLTVKDLESLLGKLSWYCEVLIAGRARLSRIRACMKGGWGYRPHPRSKVELSPAAMEDLQWWSSQLAQQASHPRLVPFWTDKPPMYCDIFSDASGDIGYGLVVNGMAYQGLWREEAIGASSCYKELVPVLLALLLLPEEANGHVVVINTDNLANVLAINKGTCKSEDLYEILFVITELAAERQLYLSQLGTSREQ